MRHRNSRRLSLIPLAALFTLLSACSWTDKNGTHHLIVGLGFGVVSTTNHFAVEVRDSRVLGFTAGPEGAGVGWMRHHRVAIDPALASNVVVSIKSNPLGLQIKNFDPYASHTNDQSGPAQKGNQNNEQKEK